MKLVLLAVALLCGGCASLPLENARQAFYQGNYEDAVEILSSKDIRSRDRLLALMEKGLIQHQAGEYENSTQTFLRATAFLEEKDYISVGEQAASVAINDWVTTYKGEYSERLWIHTFQMMNFLLLGKFEGAAVEARRALQVYADNPDTLETDFFTRAVAGLSFDSVDLPNDAYIEYLNLAESLPDPSAIASLLSQRARQIGLPAVAEKYAALSDSTGAAQQPPGKAAEVIIFVHSGNLPRKIPGNLFLTSSKRISFPLYASETGDSPELVLKINGTIQSVNPVETNLASVARKSLKARGKKIAARQIARIGVKKAIVEGVRSESESAALVVDALLFLLEEADTRSWSTLPARLQLLRIPLVEGTHDIALFSGPANDQQPLLQLDQLTLQSGQRDYHTVRLGQ